MIHNITSMHSVAKADANSGLTQHKRAIAFEKLKKLVTAAALFISEAR